jgi:hypothetical protein
MDALAQKTEIARHNRTTTALNGEAMLLESAGG